MAALLGAPLAGCTGDRANLTASFGGSVAGRRGEIQVLFINNTPWRAVFTVGTYDQTDTGDQPDFSQFGNDTEGGLVLEGGESSPIGSLDCARVFSIGGPRLLALIEENLPDAELLPEAGIEGVEFFTINTDGEADPAREGTAPPFEALLGVDFPCNALLIVRFEEDATGSFRVDFELIPSESER
jgi:hypothetical protein